MLEWNKEYEEASKSYLKAAELGNIIAQRTIAELYASGKGIAIDKQKSFEWYKIAAENGDNHSQFTLGVMYETGQVVEKNLNEAAKWYYKAAAQGYQLEYAYSRETGHQTAKERYDNVIKKGASPPTELIEKNKKQENQLLIISKFIKKTFGVTGIIIISLISLILIFFYPKIDKSLRYKSINIWFSPVVFIVGGIIMFFTGGFSSPGVDNFVLLLLNCSLIYHSYKIIKSSNSFISIILRILLTFIVSTFCFYATLSVVGFIIPIVLIYFFFKDNRRSSRNSSQNRVNCINCKYYGGEYCKSLSKRINSPYESINCSSWKWENSAGQ